MTNAGNPDNHDFTTAKGSNGNGTTSDVGASDQQAGAEAPPEKGLPPLESKIQELEAQLKEKEAKYVYLYADFENYKKRAVKDRSDLIKFGWESVARELLDVVDNLERALQHVPPGTDKNFVAGVQMTLNQFETALQKQGVKSVESLHLAFDPNLHEAVGQEPSERPEGTVVKEHTRGYTLHGRLLRPSRVILSCGKGTS